MEYNGNEVAKRRQEVIGRKLLEGDGMQSLR
jgi:hypothetical protein